MAQPGLPGSMVKGEDWLVRKVQDMERQLNELRGSASNILIPAGIRARKDAVTIENNLIVGGTLSLPNGIIDNAALASPLFPGSAGLTAQNYATTTAGAVLAQASIPVPDGYTRAVVMNGVSAGAVNSTAAPDYFQVASDINGVHGGGQLSYAGPSGGYGSGSAFGIRTITGLSGGSITVGCLVLTQNAAWAANPANTANTNALVLFLR